MVNGLKIGAIIQARYKSTRLPGKVLLPIPIDSNNTIIDYIAQAISRNHLINELVLATSVDAENDVIEEYALKKNIKLFRGSEEDVFSRFTSIIKKEKLDICVRLTADNPLIDNNKLTQAIHYLVDSKLDYVHTSKMPLGMNFEVFKADALLECENHPLTDQDKEHVTLFLRESGNFKTKIIDILPNDDFIDYRCTVDYPSDYMFMSFLLSQINFNNEDLLDELNRIVKKYPWITQINASNFQKKANLSLTEEIKFSIEILRSFELFKATETLENYSE